MNVLILGYGEMGHAMEHLLLNRHRLDIWDIYSNDQFKPVVLEEAAAMADVLLFCLPVNPHRKIAQYIEPLLNKNCICLSIAKGLDENGQTAAQIFADVFKDKISFALLYGPMISEEIRANRPAFGQLGYLDYSVFERISDLFKGTNLYIEPSTDIPGISWSVILKNVYAMVFGMADELNLGDNMRGYLAVASLHELDSIVRKMGGAATSPFHLAGLGDLITTATSEDSHHHELGRKLARGETEGISGEGIHTLAMVEKFNLFDTGAYPLFELVAKIVKNPQHAKSQIQQHLKIVFNACRVN